MMQKLTNINFTQNIQFLRNVGTRRLAEKPLGVILSGVPANRSSLCDAGDQYLMALFCGKARQREIDGSSIATVQRQLTNIRLYRTQRVMT